MSFDQMFSPFDYEYVPPRELKIKEAKKAELESVEQAIEASVSRYYSFLHGGGDNEINERFSLIESDLHATVKKIVGHTSSEVMAAVHTALKKESAGFPPANNKPAPTDGSALPNKVEDNVAGQLDWQIATDEYGEYFQAQTQDGTVYSVFPYENGAQWIVSNQAGLIAQGESATLDDAKLDAEDAANGNDPTQKPVGDHDNPGGTPPPFQQKSNAHDVQKLNPNIENINPLVDEDNPGASFYFDHKPNLDPTVEPWNK
jgi:hypothetical protein